MATATPPPTIFDLANLQLMQTWADPAIAELQRRRQLEEALAREFRVQQFAQDQQERQIKGYGENQVRAVEARTKLDREEANLQRQSAEQGYPVEVARKMRLQAELDAANTALERDLWKKATDLTRSETKNFNEIQHASIVRENLARVLPDLALAGRVKYLATEHAQAVKHADLLLSKIVTYGGKVPEIAPPPASAALDRLPMPDGTVQVGDYLGTNSPPAKSKTKAAAKRDTEGLIPPVIDAAKGLAREFGQNVQQNVITPVTTGLHNFGVELFGGDYKAAPPSALLPATPFIPYYGMGGSIPATPPSTTPIPDFTPDVFTAPPPQVPAAADPSRWGGTTPPVAPRTLQEWMMLRELANPRPRAVAPRDFMFR